MSVTIGLIKEHGLADLSELVGGIAGGSINNCLVDVVEKFIPIGGIIIHSSRVFMGKVVVSIRGHVVIGVLLCVDGTFGSM
jgi:hypothetical protein